MKKTIIMLIMLPIILIILVGCGKEQPVQMVNGVFFSLSGIKDLTISYDDEDLTFFESEDENLIIKEYMNHDKKSYHANVTQNNESIKISEGSKPFFKKGFKRYIEVYLPTSYNENLKITTTNGSIDMSELKLNVKSLRIDSTSGLIKLDDASASNIHISSTRGSIDLGTITASKIKINTTKGKVNCKHIDGNVSYTSTSGDAEFLLAVGSGTFKTNNSGKLSVVYKEVTGNLSFYNKNDNVDLILPSTLNFKFSATTKNGKINTNFKEIMTFSDKTMSGSIGENPTITVKTETRNGDINVTR